MTISRESADSDSGSIAEYESEMSESVSEVSSNESSDSESPVQIRNRLGTKRKSPRKIMVLQLAERKKKLTKDENDFVTARKRLHVSAEPLSLPCREDEFDELYSHLASALDEGTGTCIYISGVPGTGKTATFKAVLRALALENDVPAFDLVEINGMRVTEPKEAYSAFWMGLTSEKVPAAHAEHLLSSRFTKKDKNRQMCICLIDELDLLVTKKQSIVYNFFDWPNLPYSKLIVVAIANTMDLPERMLINKVSSRLGLVRMVFEPYTFQQLVKIVESRLEGLQTFEPYAIQLCARRVSQVSGDARRCLDICRRAVELFTASKTTDQLIGLNYIDMAIKEMNSSKTVVTVRRSSLYQKTFLLATIVALRKTAIGETYFDNIAFELGTICTMARLTTPKASILYELLAKLTSDGLLIVEANKVGNPGQKVKINVDENDIIAGIKLAGDAKLKDIIKRY